MKILYGYAAAFLLGAGGSWYVQGLRWDGDVQERELATAEAIQKNVDAVNQRLLLSRAETEDFRKAFIEYKSGAENEISDLERRVTAGPERLYIKGNCPAVPATGTDASRTGAGSAELDAATTRAVFHLERKLKDQYGLLQFCRHELKKRSAP